MALRKRGLGRGLDALLPSSSVGTEDSGMREIAVSQIAPNRLQPRQHFDAEKLGELADSIRQHGLVQPVIVRPVETGYELVVGERRWRAAQLAGLTSIPAVVKDLGSDAERLEIALVENLQREDLNPLEEASAFQYLISEFGLTQEEVARRVGRSRPQVANTLRLLSLDAEVREAIQSGAVTMGHAKALLAIGEGVHRKQLLRRIVERGLSVREAEDAARRASEARGPVKAREHSPSEYAAVEEQLRDTLGTRVRVKGENGRGQIEVQFYTEEDLARLVDLIAGESRSPRR